MDRRRSSQIGLLVVGLLTLAATNAFGAAQEATPAASPVASPSASTAATGDVVRSVSRDEATRQLLDHYPMEPVGNQGGRVVMGETGGDLSTVNALLSADFPSSYVVSLTNEPLVGTSPVDGSPVPALADSWDRAADGLTYTFHLSRQATWHDGTDVTAEDVRFSFDAALGEDLAYYYRSSIVALVNSYRVVDQHTFELVANEPIATFVHDVPGTIYIVPRHVWQDVAHEDWANDPGSTGRDATRVIGSGPFRFEEWTPGDHVTLARYDDYYGQKPTIDEITIRFLLDEETALRALERGEIDFYDVQSPSSVAPLQSQPTLTIDVFDSFRFAWYAMNLDPERTTLFQDKEVRQALSFALDRDAIVADVYLDLAEPATGTQPPLSIAYAPSRSNQAYRSDPAEAQRLLASAGWQDTNANGIVDKDGQELDFELLYTENVDLYGRLVPILRNAWRAIGVEMTPQPVPFETLDEALFATHEFEMGLLGFTWDVTGNQAAMFDCDSYDGGFNAMKYCDPSYDLLSEQELREFAQTTRIELLARQSNLLNEEMPVGVLVYPKDAVASSTRLHNFHPNGYSLVWSLPYVWVAA